MKKIFSFLFFFLCAFHVQVNGQVAGAYKILTMQWRWKANTITYLDANGFTTGCKIMSHNVIYGSGSANYANLATVRAWLIDEYPIATSSGYTLINWETGPFLTMKNNAKTSSAFIAAENEIIKLLREVKRVRPNVKFGMYRMPFRFWTLKQSTLYNGDGKFDNLFKEVDFIAPSLYNMFADEQVGHARNIQYMSENMDVALAYGQKFNKPVYPFFWHRMHPTAEMYAFEIIQKEVMAKYVKHILTYSHNGTKVAGAVWWDGLGDQLRDLSGINNCLNGTVYDKTTYDAMIVNYARHIKQVLGGTVPSEEVVAAQKLTSFTLINADTEQAIQTITDGATLNLATLPTKNLNIRANTDPVTVGSVKFLLSGTQSKTATDSNAPYALAGETSGNYTAWVPATGNYTLKATPYTAAAGAGTAGTAFTINFSVTNQTTTIQLPVAKAGADKVITLPTNSVSLTGTGTDADGTISGYAWRQVSGPNTATITNAAAAATTVNGLVAGTYTFSLVVKDNQNNSSAADQVLVTVQPAAVTVQQLASFTLINADTDQDLMTLADGAVLNFSTLPTKNLNIRANTSPSQVGSVVFVLSGAQNVTKTETSPPLALFSDQLGDYNAWVPAPGSYTLKATPYTAAGGTGTAGTPLTVHFSVVNQSTNHSPVALVGANQTVTLPTDSVVLAGSGTDTDGTISRYIWRQISGPDTASISDTTSAHPIVRKLVPGTYVFSLVVQDNQNGVSAPVSVSVTVQSASQLVTFTLINADTNQDMLTLTNGDTLNLATLPTKNLNIRVNAATSEVSSVQFTMTGALAFTRTEGIAPFALFGDENSDYKAWVPVAGGYTLTAVPYTTTGAGAPLALTFTVVNQAPLANSLTSRIAPAAQETAVAASVSVYPNPATTQLHVTARQTGADLVTLKLYDLTGYAVRTQQVNTTSGGLDTVVAVDSLPAGRYLLVVNSNKGLIVREHILVK